MLSESLPQQQAARVAAERLVAAELDPLADHVKMWWNMTSCASNCSVSGRSKTDERFLEMLAATTKFDLERYDVGLLRGNAKPHWPNNYISAVNQFMSFSRAD